MADRKIAAEARRVAEAEGRGGDRTASAAIREALKRQYERGKEDGRTQLQGELGSADARAVLLRLNADTLDSAAARTSEIPNSRKAQRAYREAAAILRDAIEGEVPDPPPIQKGKN